MSELHTLIRWGVIGVEGADAVTFLQAQLSNDVAGMTEGQLRMAGLCTAKGRLLGSFFVVRRADAVLLICRKDTIAALVKRLSMFVLRSKCKVMDWSDRYALHFSMKSGQEQAMSVQWRSPDEAHLHFRKLDGFMPSLTLNTATAGATDAPTGDDAFELALFKLGIAYVSLNAVELFVPQTINFDLVGGVSFSKGCYPGQEVVARSHYLGKVKRRAFKATSSAGALSAGADVWMQGKDNEPAGQVITVVAHQGMQHALIELPVDDAENTDARFFVKVDSGEFALSLEKPPYDVHQKGNQFELA